MTQETKVGNTHLSSSAFARMLDERFGSLVGFRITGMIYDQEGFIGFRLQKKGEAPRSLWVYGDEEGNHPGWPMIEVDPA